MRSWICGGYLQYQPRSILRYPSQLTHRPDQQLCQRHYRRLRAFRQLTHLANSIYRRLAYPGELLDVAHVAELDLNLLLEAQLKLHLVNRHYRDHEEPKLYMAPLVQETKVELLQVQPVHHLLCLPPRSLGLLPVAELAQFVHRHQLHQPLHQPRKLQRRWC